MKENKNKKVVKNDIKKKDYFKLIVSIFTIVNNVFLLLFLIISIISGLKNKKDTNTNNTNIDNTNTINEIHKNVKNASVIDNTNCYLLNGYYYYDKNHSVDIDLYDYNTSIITGVNNSHLIIFPKDSSDYSYLILNFSDSIVLTAKINGPLVTYGVHDFSDDVFYSNNDFYFYFYNVYFPINYYSKLTSVSSSNINSFVNSNFSNTATTFFTFDNKTYTLDNFNNPLTKLFNTSCNSQFPYLLDSELTLDLDNYYLNYQGFETKSTMANLTIYHYYIFKNGLCLWNDLLIDSIYIECQGAQSTCYNSRSGVTTYIGANGQYYFGLWCHDIINDRNHFINTLKFGTYTRTSDDITYTYITVDNEWLQSNVFYVFAYKNYKVSNQYFGYSFLDKFVTNPSSGNGNTSVTNGTISTNTNVFVLLGNGFNSVLGILDTQILPGISLFTLLMAPLVVGIILFIIWLFKR